MICTICAWSGLNGSLNVSQNDTSQIKRWVTGVKEAFSTSLTIHSNLLFTPTVTHRPLCTLWLCGSKSVG